MEILVKNPNFSRKSIFWENQIEILLRNPNFGQILNFLDLKFFVEVSYFSVILSGQEKEGI